MKFLFAIILILTSTGCITTGEEYSNYLDTFIGKKKTLVKQFGVPDKSIKLDDEEILVYINVKGSTSRPGFNSINTEYVQCQTKFTLEDGRVSEWQWDGDC